MTNAVQTPAEPDVPVADPFDAVVAEGPYGFKPDRNRPIEPHFDGFGRLTPEEARQVLDVRDGRRPRCLLQLATESVLFEHAGQGYCDPATGRQWGYRVRRVGRLKGGEGPPQPPAARPTVADVPPSAPTASPPAPIQSEVRPRVVLQWTVPEADAEVAVDPLPDPPEPDDDWAAPARSARAAALADPAERTALARVLVLWFVVLLLLADCVSLLAAGG